MARLMVGLLLALDPPLRFLLGGVFALGSGLLGATSFAPGPGYPWPGRIEFRDLPIECLLLGLVLTGAWIPSRSVPVPQDPENPDLHRTLRECVHLVLVAAAASGLMSGLLPDSGLLRPVAVLGVGLVALVSSRVRDRSKVFGLAAGVALVLVVFRYVLPGSLHGALAALPGGELGARLVFGSLDRLATPPAEVYRVFVALVLFSAAIMVRLPELAPESIPEGTLLGADPVAPGLAGTEAPEAFPGPSPATLALPPGRGVDEGTGKQVDPDLDSADLH